MTSPKRRITQVIEETKKQSGEPVSAVTSFCDRSVSKSLPGRSIFELFEPVT